MIYTVADIADLNRGLQEAYTFAPGLKFSPLFQLKSPEGVPIFYFHELVERYQSSTVQLQKKMAENLRGRFVEDESTRYYQDLYDILFTDDLVKLMTYMDHPYRSLVAWRLRRISREEYDELLLLRPQTSPYSRDDLISLRYVLDEISWTPGLDPFKYLWPVETIAKIIVLQDADSRFLQRELRDMATSMAQVYAGEPMNPYQLIHDILFFPDVNEISLTFHPYTKILDWRRSHHPQIS